LNGKEIIDNIVSSEEDEAVYQLNHRLCKDQLGNNKWYIRCYDNLSGVYESDEQLNFIVHLNSNLINVTNKTNIDNIYNASSINEAINLASPNSTIKIYKENNDEHIIINKSINLIGINYPILNNTHNNEIIRIEGHNITIGGFKILAEDSQVAINMTGNESSQLIIDGNRIEGAIKVGHIKNITLKDNIITKNAIRYGISIDECSEISILNNIINGTGNVGLFMNNCRFEFNDNYSLKNIDMYGNIIYGMETGIKVCPLSEENRTLLRRYIASNNNNLLNFSLGYDVRSACT
jgi:nitrous oxidase accessory protein NosD